MNEVWRVCTVSQSKQFELSFLVDILYDAIRCHKFDVLNSSKCIGQFSCHLNLTKIQRHAQLRKKCIKPGGVPQGNLKDSNVCWKS